MEIIGNRGEVSSIYILVVCTAARGTMKLLIVSNLFFIVNLAIVLLITMKSENSHAK